MIRNLLLPLLALAGLLLALQTVASGSKPVQAAAPVADPARRPFETSIAGAGIVEARSQNIALGTPISGVVSEVAVQVGDVVALGTPLFRLDDRDRRAALDVQKAALASARADLTRLESFPRPEDVPPVEARVAASAALLDDARSQLELAESLDDKRAIAMEDWNRRRFAVKTLEARHAEAQGELLKLKAGSWKPELEIARAKVASAEAFVKSAEVELERLIVRAPVDCTVLQVNVRKGEFANAGALATPLMLVGDLGALHVRVDVDENDAWRLERGARAEAYVRGNGDLRTPLEFVRVEPYVVPKRSLTGESTERVDTRVLQVIYRFDPKSLAVYVGQQMDVFIEAPGLSRNQSARAPEASAK
jgi:multidrug efflux pump subunit AcrA (membrane-fusion protein)